ncbi:hypothetical protein MKX01_032694 [Papaver californicum]|nr:hypothetical protein MKX01_032694 [Papaver californicum]
MASMNLNLPIITPIYIDGSKLRSLISYPSLLNHLQTTLPAISTKIESPIRHNHSVNQSSSLLLMPSWSQSDSFKYIGVKIVTTFPENSSRNLPGVHASYLLFDSITGKPLSIMDGSELTHWRTSCVSGLASKYLSRNDVEVLVMIGAGSLAEYLIKAHLCVRPSLNRVIIWNRNGEKAVNLVKKLQEEGISGVGFEYGECVEEIIKVGDVISCATSSGNPIVKGVELKEGVHLDLVGSFTPLMRECDDEAIKRGKVFVDNEAALVEAGEFVGAFSRGVIAKEEIRGSLIDLITGKKNGRNGDNEITVFKSVGSAVVDIVSAQLVYETYLEKSNL